MYADARTADRAAIGRNESFMRRALMFGLFLALASTSLIARVPAVAASDTCASPIVRQVGDSLVATLREPRPSAVVYRLDDVAGHWLFPATNAQVMTFALPAAASGSVNLSIVQETESDGNIRTCPPRPQHIIRSRSDDPAAVPADAEHLEPLPFVSEPLPCGWLDRPARIVNAVAPVTPRAAAEQGIQGSVGVEIALDENSEVTSATIVSSPAAILNEPALEAARRSTFQAEQFRCASIPAHFIFIVNYQKP